MLQYLPWKVTCTILDAQFDCPSFRNWAIAQIGIYLRAPDGVLHHGSKKARLSNLVAATHKPNFACEWHASISVPCFCMARDLEYYNDVP